MNKCLGGENLVNLSDQKSLLARVFFMHPPNMGGGGEQGIVFAGGWEMKIFSAVFRDFGKNIVRKWYFQH